MCSRTDFGRGNWDNNDRHLPHGFDTLTARTHLPSPTSGAGSRVLTAGNHLAITISELKAQLKRDHAWGAIPAQTDAE
jgi:hypothetical protein